MLLNNLWAPWRQEYLNSLDDSDTPRSGCFLCDYWNQPQQDVPNLTLWRGRQAFVIMNRFPYTAGHLLVAPVRHVPDIIDLDPDILLEMLTFAQDAEKILRRLIKPQGFNIGINVQRCSGAGLPDHVHMHIVPRWSGDTNFMTTLADARVISQSLQDLYHQLIQTGRRLNLPRD